MKNVKNVSGFTLKLPKKILGYIFIGFVFLCITVGLILVAGVVYAEETTIENYECLY